MDTTTFRPTPRCPNCTAGETSYVLTLGIDHPEEGRITALEVGGFAGAVEAIDTARLVQGARADLAYDYMRRLHPDAEPEADAVSVHQLHRYHIVGATINEYTEMFGTTESTDLY